MSLEQNPKKSLGQHWLQDESVLESICSAADIQSSDTILEIGPGLGSLTKLLIKKARKVVAIEIDASLIGELYAKLKADNLEVINEDILKFDLSKLEPGYKIVANIPYYLTSNLIRVLSESVNPPQSATLLVQKEVAERLAASVGNMSLLSVTAQYYWQIVLANIIPARLFTPPPQVDSQIVVLRYRETPLFPGVDVKKYFKIVRAGFSQKRKTLINSLSGGLAVSKEKAKNLLEIAKINPLARAQTLTLEDWYRLYKANNGID